MINPYDPRLMRQSLDAWQKSIDLYRSNPWVEMQQAWLQSAQAWMAWSNSMTKLWHR